MTQQSLFPTIPCNYCLNNIGLSSTNADLMDGFWDNKYQFFVCNGCREKHYQLKPGYYTEMPLTFYQAKQKQQAKEKQEAKV